MRVLIACEFSGIVREAFRERGHDAWSCDLEPTEIPGRHIQGDVREILNDGWDMMIAHPPCTHLSRSGQRFWEQKRAEQQEAIEFVNHLWNAPIPAIVIENPRGILSYRRPFMDYGGGGYVWRMYDQLIQPWQFGEQEQKATCLWLRNVPPLLYSLISLKRNHAIHDMGPVPERPKIRARTFPGIAKAMAQQWSSSPIVGVDPHSTRP